LRTCGLRVLNLERLFNCREGLDRGQDVLPGRLTGEPLPEGPSRGAVVPLGELLEDGYRALGWDPATGRPRPETLAGLGLDDL
jgi:aldehyde:ferredoxin oxidoreductase